jgi:hypothetical protein
LGLEYKLDKLIAPTAVLVERVREQFAAAGCRVR